VRGAAPTLRQAVEGMALAFDREAAAGQRAVIEFEAPAERPARCHLVVEGGSCRFAAGAAPAPSLRIRSDGETWKRIGRGELDFLAAAGSGAVVASGDLAQTQLLGRWFRRDGAEALRSQAGRPPGPLRLPAMAWLAVAFAPWKALWIGAALGAPQWGAVAGAVLATLLVAYRRRAGGATFLENASALALAALAAVAPAAPGWRAPALGLAALGAIWGLGAARALPLTAEYARWRYLPALAETALFRYPNALITLAWSAGLLACAAVLVVRGRGLLGSGPAALVVLAVLAWCLAFTRAREGGARDRRIDDIDRRLRALRVVGGALAVLGAALACMVMMSR